MMSILTNFRRSGPAVVIDLLRIMMAARSRLAICLRPEYPGCVRQSLASIFEAKDTLAGKN